MSHDGDVHEYRGDNMEGARAVDGRLAHHYQDKSQVTEVHVENAQCHSWPHATKDIKTNPRMQEREDDQ